VTILRRRAYFLAATDRAGGDADLLGEGRLARPSRRMSGPLSLRGEPGLAGEPYLEHLYEVTGVLVEAVGITDVDVLRAAVLHDVVEDSAYTLAALGFG
jgi:hypothetical protein